MKVDKNSTDEELFLRVKKSDAKALRVLFESYFSPLCRFAWKFVNDEYLAEEIVSDVFVHVWMKREEINITGTVKPYLYTAVKNQSLNTIKKKTLRLEDMETVAQNPPVSVWHAEQLVTAAELEHDIDKLLRRLPPQRQIIFRMNRFDGLSYKEIAEILSISIHTVQNQMVAAIKFLSSSRLRT
jgi:RNA polymerase sigma-70 factor, ECF subfamily